MKKTSAIIFTVMLSASIALGAQVPSSSWGDSQSSGYRESASTSMFAPGRCAFDGNTTTYWQLSAGSTEGWLEAYGPTAQRYAGTTINASIPAGVQLSFSILSNGSYITIPAGTIQGPLDGSQTLLFPGELLPTTRVLVELTGQGADQAKIYEIQWQLSGAPQPFGKVLPKSYTTNFPEYINIKASRLWNGINDSDWFEPLWSLPSEPFQTDAADKPTAIFPPYLGNPPTQNAQIVWQLDGTYQIQVLKTYLINPGRWVRFEFWQNGKWTTATDLKDQSSSGWQRVQLASPVTTTQIRISFPGGWEQARFLGQVQVWGQGWADAPSRSLAISPAGGDGYQHFTLDNVDQRNYLLKAIVPGTLTTPLTGQWNGNPISMSPVAQVSGSTIYQIALPVQSLIPGQQFLKLLSSGNLTGVSLDVGEDKGLIDLGTPWDNGFFDQSDSASAGPLMKSKTWSLGNTYQLEKLRVYMKGTTAPLFQTQLKNSKQKVSWTSTGSGWWEASFAGDLADTLIFTSAIGFSIDQIQLYGTPLNDTKVDLEIWWPQSSPTSPAASNGLDSNSVIGWMGDSSIQPTINGFHPRQSDKLFWMPLNQMALAPGGSYALNLNGTLQNLSAQVQNTLYWWQTPIATLTQGVGLATTTQSSLTLSGTDTIAGSLCYIGGTQVPVVGGKFSYAAPLANGYQIIPVEIWSSQKKSLLISWQKPAYRSLGGPTTVFDLPHGDFWTQSSTILLTGRVGNGPGLSLSLEGKSVALTADAFQQTMALTEGTQTLSFILSDSLGRKTTQDLVIYKDATPPQIAITSPTAGQYITTSTFNMIVSGGSDSELWWKFNADPWQAGPVNPEVQSFTLADGFYTYGVQAQDRSGNLSNTATVSFCVDTKPPVPFTITTNVSGWTNNNRPIITFATTDATSGVDHYIYNIDSGTTATIASPYQLPTLSDGVHIVTVTAFDKAGNRTQESLTLQVDVTPPVAVTTLQAIPGESQITVSWSPITSDVSGIASYFATRNPAWPDGTHPVSSTSFSDAGLVSGTAYSYTVWAVDNATNIGAPSTTAQTVVGLAVAPVVATTPTVVAYQNIKAVVPTDDLPAGTAAVLIQTVTSPTLQNVSNYPIVSPIYSISTLAVAENGNLQETTHTELPKQVLVTLDYDPALLPNGFPEANLGVYYYDTTWSKWFKVENSAVDVAQKKIIFTTNHFTDFSVQPTMITDLSPQQLKDIGHSPVKTESSAGAVTVSPQGGTAMTEVTDFVLQGKNGFTLPIKRMYDTGTAVADSPSLSLSASLHFNDITSLFSIANITAQLANSGVGDLTGAILSKVTSMVQHNGDYALATGVGWRLNFPYVMTTNASVAVRLPNGGYYNVNQMQSNNNFWTSNPVSRTLDFEFHEGEDFHFRVTQVRSNVTDLISSIPALSNAAMAAIKGSTPGATGIVSLVASLIPGWASVYSELWTKDGTYYVFDGNGRITKIIDKTGLNTFTFHYNGLLLNDVTDDLGRQILFQYNVGSTGAGFVKPVITKIWTSGFKNHDQGGAPGPQTDTTRAVNFTYNWNAASSIGTFFNFLPTLSSTSDPEGRQYSYSYTQQTIVTGGGAIKINFLALLLDIIPGAGSAVADMLGVSALTLSGNLEINLPFTISQVIAPGIGTTTIRVDRQDLSQFNFTPTDYFLGLFPTALQVSYQIIFRLQTGQVIVTSSNGVTKTVNYGYHWSSSGDNQYYVDTATVDDGRLSVVHNFSAHEVSRNRFISWDDYLQAVAEELFQSTGYSIQELFTLESGTVSTSDASGQFVESVSNSWDITHHRLTAVATTRGTGTTASQGYQYDTWGNQVYILDDSVANGREQKSETWNWYLNSGSSAPAVWSFPTLGADESLADSDVRDLLKGSVVRAYRPDAAGGGYDERDQGYVYNSLGLQKAEGLWLGDHWATTALTYFTDSSQLSAGAMQSKTGPIAGQQTTWAYDYSRTGDFYVVTQTTQTVADPTGNIASLVQETAYDWPTAWKLYDKNARGYVTEYVYDRLGRTTTILSPGDEAPLAVGQWGVVHTNAPRQQIAYVDTQATSTATVSKGTFPSGTPRVFEQDSYDNLGQLFRIDKYNTLGASTGHVATLAQTQTSSTQASYDGWGDVTSMTDPDSNTTSYSYDYKGRTTLTKNADSTQIAVAYDDGQNLRTTTNERGVITKEWLNWHDKTQTKVEDAGNLSVTTQTYYNGLDQVVAVTDALDQTTVTYYSPFGKPSSVQHPAVGIWESPAQPVTVLAGSFSAKGVTPQDIYGYDDAGQLVSQQSGYQGTFHETDQTFDTAGRVIKKKIGVPGDTREEWSWYDADGNLAKHADALLVSQLKAGQGDPNGSAGFSLKTYSSRDKILTETDPLGAMVRYQYDFLDRKVQMKDPRSTPTGTDNFTINYSYDDLDRLILADLPPVAGQGRGTETIAYDLRGNATTVVDPIGKTTTWSYDSRNRKTSQSVIGADGTGPLLNAWGYDAVGNTTAEIVASSINSASPGQSLGLVTAKVYDNLNRLTETDLPDEQKKITTYDALGRATAIKDAAGDTTNNTYNSLNKITATEDPTGNYTYLYYDVWGDTTATLGKNPVNGDQIWVRYFNPYSQVAYEQNNSRQLWSYTYDPRGLLTGSSDPNGTSATNIYSLTGLLTQKTLTNATQTQGQNWTYDIAGSLMGGSDGGVSTAINQAGGIYTPDPYDLIDSYTTMVGTKSLSLAYTYDNAHKPLSLTYPDGSTINYQYNGLEELTTIPGYASNGQYNYMGRLTSLQALNGTKRTKTWNASMGTLDGYSWNVAGKTGRGLVWDTRGNLQSQSKDGNTSSYFYDQLSRLEYAQEGGDIETHTDASMPQGSQQRDVAGARGLDFSNPSASVKLDYYSSSIGVDLTSSQDISKVRLIGVSPRIQPRTVEVYISQDGEKDDWTKLTDTTFIQDETGVTLLLKAPHQAQFVKLHMTWDERDQNDQPVDQHTLAGTVGQLLQVWYNVDGQTTSFIYDSLGNRVLEDQTRASSIQTNYTYYPNSSRVKQAGNWEFNYDANGNMTSRGTNGATDTTTGQFDWDPSQGELWQYSYDLKNRLVSVQHGFAGSSSLQSVAQYTYDMRDLRIETVKPAATTYSQYDQSGDLIWHDDGTETRKYIEALGQIWAEVRTVGTTSQTYFHSTDHEGSTNVITDASGNIVWDGDYEAFGSVVRSNGSMAFEASYTGKEFDTDTGLYYFNARFYDPQLGRFITEDPARSGDNWFAYVGNNPLTRVDPNGLDTQDFYSALNKNSSDKNVANRLSKNYSAISNDKTSKTADNAVKQGKYDTRVGHVKINITRRDVAYKDNEVGSPRGQDTLFAYDDLTNTGYQFSVQTSPTEQKNLANTIMPGDFYMQNSAPGTSIPGYVMTVVGAKTKEGGLIDSAGLSSTDISGKAYRGHDTNTFASEGCITGQNGNSTGSFKGLGAFLNGIGILPGTKIPTTLYEGGYGEE